jgi:hypothetical protein
VPDRLSARGIYGHRFAGELTEFPEFPLAKPLIALTIPGEQEHVAHVGQMVADLTPRIAHKNDDVARLTL